MTQIEADASPPQADRTIQSVDRALSVLEAIARQRGEVTLQQICEELGLNASTCHHILRTLMVRNYVRPGTARGRYMLGSQIVMLAEAVNVKAELPGRAKPVMDELNRVTEEAVHLAVFDRDEMITLVKREARHALKVDSGSIGKSRAMHATATGKVLLSGMSEDEVRRLCALHGMARFTINTCTDPDALLAELEQDRARGFSEDREEFQLYVVCTGAAVRDPAGRVIASLSVSTPINRATDAHLGLVRREVMAAGRKLSLTSLDMSEVSSS
ncbi:IclR family transcriptional regulator [Mangrovicoccus sp. HB161399]|uniref:IclR family transcriptional regulator n=1 Tax=Mangrovicoccus sp. HB161399 TaxID=2720392 RepID=UPI001554520D|nr:IclR family transcriptional regulator [Mangrovicoccus sp. HB161399]